jgi:hypothetical protein
MGFRDESMISFLEEEISFLEEEISFLEEESSNSIYYYEMTSISREVIVPFSISGYLIVNLRIEVSFSK